MKLVDILYCWEAFIVKIVQLLIGFLVLIIITFVSPFIHKRKLEHLTDQLYSNIKYDEWF